MFKKLKASILSLILVFSSNQVFADDVPVIVISPSKTTQSVSTVGTSVTVLNENFFQNSNELFLGDVLKGNSNSVNFFSNGGPGQTSAIQLRGMPKRYSTVYIDGVKMSDPSSVSNDYDFNHILTSQISRVEILKGNQSSIYGSGAVGGTINITTKKGEPGLQKNIQYNNASHGTHNLSLGLSGADEANNFYVGLERFQTDGMSAMTHNDEKDRYRNNSLVAKYGRKLSEQIKFESNVRVAETYMQYDKETATATADHAEEVDAVQSSAHISLLYEPNAKFNNKLTLANTYVKRIYAAAPSSGNTQQDDYYGDRYALSYSGGYNFNLDNSIVFGVESEHDEIQYDKNLAGLKEAHAYATSSYFDLQSRVTNNIYATFGSRFDEHKHAGNEDSHRATLAYLFDNKSTKLKTSYGTGMRFPSLFELNFLNSFNSSMAAESSESFDFGIEKSFSSSGLSFDATYFNIKYTDALEGWKGPKADWSTNNFPGVIKSQGLELDSKWLKSDQLNFGLNYTYTSTYDGAEQDDPDMNASYFMTQMVRVPRHLINLKTNMKIPGYKNLDLSLNTKWSDDARDYGNGNRTWRDERLDDYLVNDLSIKYNLFNTYNLFFDINNILDEKYETVRDYSQMDRSYNFGIRRTY
ncbi:TonB-dependent receptor [Pelagibacteraceae bacterium]|nr:TonB-dependent receptor [Pelagibacteraceae bacterium]